MHCGIPNAYRLCYMNVKYIILYIKIVYYQGNMFRPLLGHLQALWENRSKSYLYFNALWDPKCLQIVFNIHITQSASIWNPTIHWDMGRSWICFPRGPEDDLIKAETCRPDNIYFYSLQIKCCVIDWHVFISVSSPESTINCRHPSPTVFKQVAQRRTPILAFKVEALKRGTDDPVLVKKATLRILDPGWRTSWTARAKIVYKISKKSFRVPMQFGRVKWGLGFFWRFADRAASQFIYLSN